MLRIATLMLCLLLAAAAAGRYRAEVSVRELRETIQQLEVAKVDEERRIQVLRAELAWLESPDRLVKIAQEKTTLEPLTGAQLMTTGEFVSAVRRVRLMPNQEQLKVQSAMAALQDTDNSKGN